MNPDEINKAYWSNAKPEQVLAGLHFPQDDFLTLLSPGSKILDVGCGAGKISEYLQAKGFDVAGIDINPAVLDLNKGRNAGIEYVAADITQRLPFAQGQFDAAIVPYVLVSIIDPIQAKAAAGNIARVLKSGAMLWVCEATYSQDYEERYKKGKEATGMDNVALSFAKASSQASTADSDAEPKVERVIRHYSQAELDDLFAGFERLSGTIVSVVSPSSGMTVNTLVAIYKKA